MSQIRIIVLFLFFQNIFCDYSYSQTKLLSKKEIAKLSLEANNSYRKGDFEKSLLDSRFVLTQAIGINDCNLIANSYNIIAANFNELQEFDKAIFFYKKGLFYANKTNNDTLKNRINNNLGNMYCFEKKQYKKGINYYEKSLYHSKITKDTAHILLTKLNVVWVYFDRGLFDKGFNYLKFINKYHPKFGDKTTLVSLNMLNGMYYGYKNENEKANSYFLNAIKTGKEGLEKSDLSYSYQEYSKFLLKNGDYKNAYLNLELYNKIKDELYNEEKITKTNIAGINFELDEYKRQIDKIENEKDLQMQSLKKSRIIFVLFIIALSVLSLLFYSLYKNYNFKKKTNADLILANHELLIAKEKAEEVSRLKTQFVSTISHELRTPLYGVVGITNMLVDEHKELAQSPYLSSLKFSAKYLLSLVNDILQINKIEENKIILENTTFNLQEEINMIKNSLSFLAKNNNDRIIISVDPKIPKNLVGDRLRLVQILVNLASNALKFTNDGEVMLIAELVKIEKKSYSVEFKIKDNGIGIAEIDQEKIFDKFVQVGRKDGDYQGTGLGLSIVKRLLALFDSKITVKSKIDEGTEFCFTIAFDIEPEKTVELRDNKKDLIQNQVYKILVVEDNKINQIVTKKIIEKSNYTCTLADDGFRAIEILENQNFDIILMDINMPLMNGFETTKKIRLKGISTPIIVLTAFGKEEIIEEALSVGINDIIVKPFEPEKLFETINNLIAKHKEVV